MLNDLSRLSGMSKKQQTEKVLELQLGKKRDIGQR